MKNGNEGGGKLVAIDGGRAMEKRQPTMPALGIDLNRYKEQAREKAERIRANRGRPSKFEPEMVEKALMMGTMGYSRVQIAAELCISKQTLLVWAAEEDKKCFSDALELAHTLAQSYWETIGHDGMLLGAGLFNASIWSRLMAARFPDDWRESKVVKAEHEDGPKRAKATEDARARALELMARAQGLNPMAASLASRNAEPEPEFNFFAKEDEDRRAVVDAVLGDGVDASEAEAQSDGAA